jgi:hypothetical protein
MAYNENPSYLPLLGNTGQSTSGFVLTSTGASTPPTFQASTASAGIITISGSLTNAQIKALHGTPIQLLAAPGAGKIIACIQVWLKLVYGGTNAFTGAAGQTVNIVYGTAGSISFASNIVMQNAALTDTKTNYNLLGVGADIQDIASTSLENLGLFAYNASTSEINGNAANNNTITYLITYQVISI